MAFRKKNINEIFGTVLVLSALLSTASAVDCIGKSFHCVNSTHFMICVDLGGGVSQSIDDFLIPCPPPTVCQGNNHFECEFPAVTTPSTTLSNVTEPWEKIVVTTNSPPKNTSTTKEYSEKYMNTVSISSIAEDNLTTGTTVDVTTDAYSLSDVNSKSNITEIVPISPIYEVTTPFDGITQTISNNIVTGAAEVTNAMPEIIPLHQIQNVTNETIIDNVTLTFSNTKPTVTLNNNYTIVQNNSAGEVRNITVTSQSDNVTSKNIIDDIVTPDISPIDSNTGTERPLTSITYDSPVTGINLVVTTAQTLVYTDELQKLPNINIQTTTPEPALIKNTLGEEQFQKPVFEQNFTTEFVQNFEKEPSSVLTPDIAQNVPALLPITTFQPTVTTVTSMNIKDEIIVETTITPEQPTTTMYKVNFLTTDHDIYTTEAPLTIATYTKQDTQNTSTSDQVPTKSTDDAFFYTGNEESTTYINSLPTSIDVTTEKPIAHTTETQKVPVTEQLKINKDNSATEQVQKLIDTGIETPISSQNRTTDVDAITVKPSGLATEAQQGTEEIIIIKNITTGNDAPAQASLPTETQKPIDKKIEQSKNSTQSLAINNYALTENPSEFSMETQKLLVTEQPKINKDNSATDQVQNTSTSDQVPTKSIDDAFFYTGNEEPTTYINSLPTNIDVTTEKPIAHTTETQKVPVTEQLKINKDNSATEQVQKLTNTGIETPISSQNRTTDVDAITVKPSGLATEAQQQQGTEEIIIIKNITTGNDAPAQASLPTETQKPMDKKVEQSKNSTQSLAIDNYALTENPSEFSTETQKLLVTEQPKINKDNSATDQVQKLIDTGIESSKKLLTTVLDVITENPIDLTTKTQHQYGTEQIVINKKITTTGNDMAAGVIVLPTEVQKLIDKGIEQSKDSIQSLVPDNDTLTENTSGITTESLKQVRATPLTTNKNSSVTANDALTEASIILPAEGQTPMHKGVEQQKMNTNSMVTETVSVVTTVTQSSTYVSTERLATSRRDLLPEVDVTTEKAGIYTTDTHEPPKQITEEIKPIANKNYFTTENYTTTEKVRDFTTEAQKPINTSTEQSINGLKSTATYTINENSVLSIETQKPAIYTSTPQPITKATDIDVNVTKANVSVIATPKQISTSTELPTITKNDLATEIKVTTEAASGSTTRSSKPTIQIQAEVQGLSDHNIVTEQQKQESLTTDTISSAIITTGVITQSSGVTEQSISNVSGDSIVTDTTISNINKLQNNISSNVETTGTIVFQTINTTTATTTEPTTLKIAEDKIKGEMITLTSSVKASVSNVVNELPVDNVQTTHNTINEQPNKNIYEVKAGNNFVTTVKTVDFKKDGEASTAGYIPNLSKGHQLSTNIDRSNITNVTTTDAPFNIVNEKNISINNNASSVNTPSTFGINEMNYLSPNTAKPTQDAQTVVGIDSKNQYVTESNFKVIGTAFTTKETKTNNNVDGSDVHISNNAGINEYTSKTDKAKSELHTMERVNLIPVENIANQLPVTETTATTDWGSISISNLNPVLDSLDSNLQEVNNNQTKNSNSAYSGQLAGAEVTSETTATENLTPSLYPNNESSHNDKYLTSNNQVTTKNTNSVIDNSRDGISSFTTTSNTILKGEDDDLNTLLKENGNIYKTLTSLNTQDNSYVSFTTDKSPSFHDNIANNQIPKLTINENEIHETLQVSTPTNTFQPSSVNNVNNKVYVITPITRVIENTGTAFTQKSTTVDGIDFESHVSNKNETDQHVEITTETFHTRQPTPTTASNENINNLLPNPLYNILLDKRNQTIKPASESSTPFRINNDGNIKSMGISSSDTYSIMDDRSTQIAQIQNANGVTTQASIQIVRTNDNLPSSALDSLSLTGDLHKTKYSAGTAKTENPSVIQPKTNHKETSITKEALFLNGGNVVTSPALPMTDSTTEFSIIENVNNAYKTIGSYFSTPSQTSTPGSFKEKENGDINPIPSPYDFQDSTKTSSSMYTESSLQGIKDNYDLLISKLGPVPTISNLQPPVAYSSYYTETSKIEITSYASKNNEEPVISAALPVPDYKIEMNTPNINKPIPPASLSQGTKTSDTKLLQELYKSATYNPSKYITSPIYNYQYVTEKSDTSSFSKSIDSIVNISSETSLSSPQTAFKTYAKSLSGESNEQNVAISNKSQYNSSVYADTASSGSNLTIFAQSNDFQSPNNLTHTTEKLNHSKSQSNSTIATSHVNEKVGLARNTTKNENSGAIEKKLLNNRSYGPFAITVTSSKNVSQNSINTTKYNSNSDFQLQSKITTNSTEHNSGQVKPATTKQKKIHSVITTLQAPIIKITPRPVVPMTTTENPSKQILKTAPVNFSCINGIRGRYSDKDDCRKFYICIGNSQPIVGNCPANTVFSDISKLCTKNLSHCIRENEFKCPSAGRFIDVIKNNVYYICVSHKNHFYRFKFQCQKGFTLNKITTRCKEKREIELNQSVSISLSENSNDESTSISSKTSSSSRSSSSSSASSSSSSDISSMSTSSDSSSSSKDSGSGDSNSSSSKDNSNSSNASSSSKSKEKKVSKEKLEEKEEDEEGEVFECEKEGKFPVRNNCKRYYLCKKNGKSEYRRKIKKCESGEVFHKGKKNSKNSSESNDSESDGDRHPSNRRQRKQKNEELEGKEDENDHQEVFECEREGKFPVPGDCRRYYLCKKNRKSEYRRKIKKCDSDEVFHKSMKKCVDADSYEC